MKQLISPKQAAYLFFLKHAGYSVKQGETQCAGRSRCARELAKAERDARALGYTFEWVFDQSGCIGCDCGLDDCPCFSGDAHETLGCVVHDAEQNVLASLWGICDPAREYCRVIEAELALESL